MKFGPVKTQDAAGALLAHSMGLSGGRLKKGHKLSQADVTALAAEGHDQIVVARLEPGDVEENEAAARLAKLLSDDNMIAEAAFTGRANLYAKHSGIFEVEAEVVDALNRVDPSITLATLADDIFVEEGRMVATVKIIPLAVAGDALAKAEGLLGGQAAMKFSPSRPHKVGLVATRLPTLKPATMDKTAKILAERLERAGSTLNDEERVGHNADAVADALRRMKDKHDLLIVFGASAITDRLDVIPAGIEQAGGTVVTFGMPVDPGNLLLNGKLDDVFVIGAPGCARSPAENGFDWVLQRTLAGLSTDVDYVTGLGVGGLLMEIKARPQPREG